MNTQTHTPSPPTSNGGQIQPALGPRPQEAFRQHAAQLHPELFRAAQGETCAAPRHWMLDDSACSWILASAAADLTRLERAQGSASAAGNEHLQQAVGALGFGDAQRPAGLFAYSASLAKLVLAATRLTLRVETQIAQLARAARLTSS